VSAFLSACTRNNQQATNIPAEWATYLPTNLPRTTQTPSSTTPVDSRDLASSRMLPPTTSTTSTLSTSPPSTPSPSTSTSTTSTTVTASPAMTMSQATSVSQAAAQSSSTNWAGIQKPICAVSQSPFLSLSGLADSVQITEGCLVDKDKIDQCGLEDLQCVCKTSNSIANNKFFDQNCLYATCYNDIGRRGTSFQTSA
jgi:hypothetical protein